MINRLIALAIERRYLVLCLSLLLIASGFISYQKLPIDAVPDITNVQVQINTKAPGYSPLEVEQRITFPVETALYGLPELSHTRSLSRYGLSQVTVIFVEGTDIHFARNLIETRLSAIQQDLPAGLTPRMGPVTTGLGEVLNYTVAARPNATDKDGAPITPSDLREVQDWIITPQLLQVPGVAEVNTIGGHEKQFQVLPQPVRMLELNVSFNDIIAALEHNNTSRGAGYIEKNGQQLLVRSPGQLGNMDDIRQLVVGTHGGLPITLDQVAEVAIGQGLRTGAATLNGEETVLGTVMMRMGENSRQVAKDAAARLTDILPSLPDWAELEVVYNRTHLVDRAIQTVQKNLLEGALFVIAVLFLLLGNLRAALITAAVIPLAMFATLTGMVQRGVSANLMSLGALDFGLIVDGAVIIVENCIRRLGIAQRQRGGLLPLSERLEETLAATREVIKPSLFGVAIITLVYLPIFTLEGVEGKMFHPMAATVVMALIAAMLLSLTLVPAACAVFLNGPIKEQENPLMRQAKSAYLPLLQLAFRWQKVVAALATLLVAFCLWLATTLGTEFVPQLDEGDVALHALRINGTSLNQSLAMQKLLEKKLLSVAEVDKVFARIGTSEVATDPMPPNVADTFIMLKPRNAWPDPDKSKTQLVAELHTVAKTLPGNKYEFTQPIEMRFNELISGVRADVGIKVFGDDLAQLLASANAIAKLVGETAGAADTRVEQVDGLPLVTITPKRLALAHYGVNVSDLQALLATAIAGSRAGTIYQGDRRFALVVRLPNAMNTDLEQLAALPLELPNGGYVPLAEVASLTIDTAPAQISRENGKRRVVVTTNVRGRDLGGFVAEIRQTLATNIKLPSGYWLEYDGSFKQLESASQRLAVVIPLTLLLIVGLLIMAFGSLKDALIIFAGVPFALTGGVLALWLRDMPLSISAGVGFIALSGVAILNGLVLLSFIRERWQATGQLLDSIFTGAMTRLRPVLMTALVASLGFIPMALNSGTGAEVQRPLATVVIGGIISSTLLTLLVLPLLYHWLHRQPPASQS